MIKCFVCVCLGERWPTLNSSFIINADISKCLLSGSTRLISSSLAYAIIENKRVCSHTYTKVMLVRTHIQTHMHTQMQRGI